MLGDLEADLYFCNRAPILLLSEPNLTRSIRCTSSGFGGGGGVGVALTSGRLEVFLNFEGGFTDPEPGGGEAARAISVAFGKFLWISRFKIFVGDRLLASVSSLCIGLIVPTALVIDGDLLELWPVAAASEIPPVV